MKNKSLNLNIILLILAFGLLINVGSYGVVETSDARYAEIAREMFKDGDWIHPNLLNIHHYHKPPFTYQITAVAYSIFGINSFAARFFLQLSVLFQVWLVYQIALLLFRKKEMAILSAAIYASLPLVLISSRNLTTDSFLTSFVLLAIYAWLKYYREEKSFYLYLFALSLGFGFYTKGPVVFIVVFIFSLLYSYFNPKKNKWNKHHFFAFLLFLVTGLWWYLFLAYENSDFIDYFLGKQTLERFAKNSFHRAMPWWYFIVLAPITTAPWALLWPYFIKEQHNELKKNKIVLSLFLAILIPIFFFSLSTSKRILYILPFYGFIALLTAYFILNSSPKKQKTAFNFISIFYLFFPLSMIIAFFLEAEFILPVALFIFSILYLFVILYIWNNKRMNLIQKFIYNAVLFSVFILIASGKFMSENALLINSPKPLTEFIKEKKLDTKTIYIYNSRQPSISFELNKPVISLYKNSNDLNRETQFENNLTWKNYLINVNNPDEWNSLQKKIQENQGVLITFKVKEKDTILSKLMKYYQDKKVFGKYTVFYGLK